MMDINWKDILVSVFLIAFALRFLVYYLKSHKSDKYHNDSWRSRNKK